MPELATIMHAAKPAKRAKPPAPKPVNKAKLARDFARLNKAQIVDIVDTLNACKTLEATEKLRKLHASARDTRGLEHFHFSASGLTPGGRELLKNLWLSVNGERGSSKVIMHVV